MALHPKFECYKKNSLQEPNYINIQEVPEFSFLHKKQSWQNSLKFIKVSAKATNLYIFLLNASIVARTGLHCTLCDLLE